MPTITVYVSEQLHDRLKQADINQSQVAAEAWERALTIKKSIDLPEEDMQILKKKILEQKEQSEEVDFEAGKECAEKLAKLRELTYDDIQAARKNQVTSDTREYIQEQIDMWDDPSTADIDVAIEGFVAGVNELATQMGIDK